jgi:hypothetical protein
MVKPIQILNHKRHDLFVKFLIFAGIAKNAGETLIVIAVLQYFFVEVDVQISFSLDKCLLAFNGEVRLRMDEQAQYLNKDSKAICLRLTHIVGILRKQSFKG